MHENFSIHYTDRALSDLDSIKNFILLRFTQREVENVYTLLLKFERTVSVFPDIYPISIENIGAHRAVLSKQLSVFYEIDNGIISVLVIIDNRMDYDKWPS